MIVAPDKYQRLFDYMHYQHGLVLTDSEMETIAERILNPFGDEFDFMG